MKKKIKILMAPSDLFGVGAFRSIWPAQSIEKNFSDEFDVEINHSPNTSDIEYLSKFDIIHFHRTLGAYEQMESLMGQLKKRGVITVMDLDDHWEPSVHHPLYDLVKSEGLSEKIKKNLSLVDYVSTTTDIFAKYISKVNPNVVIMPNAIDSSQKMWSQESATSDKCRIAWIGGSSHLHDLKILENDIKKVYSSEELRDKFQFVLCGFDTRGTITEQYPDGRKITRPVRPEETVWNSFEKIFTSNYQGINNPEYVAWLKKIVKGEFTSQETMPYVRRWTLPLTQYGKHYDYCDVCLAPLEESEKVQEKSGTKWRTNYFNEVKSELKIIEAGMKGKLLIAQDFGVYKELIKNNKNGILVNSKDKDGWFKAIKKVVLNKDFREELAGNLHEFVTSNYELDFVTTKRVEEYKKMIKQKDLKELEILEKQTGKYILEDNMKQMEKITDINGNYILKGIIQRTSEKTKNRPY